MTHLLHREESSTHPAATPAPARLSLKTPEPSTGSVDGAWWPRSSNLVAEVPSLLEALASRLGTVSRVVYHLAYWEPAPSRLEVGGCAVRLDGYRFQPIHTVYIIGTNRDRLVLLVVPPATNSAYADETMATAATANNASTADQLLLHMNVPGAVKHTDSNAA